MIPENTDIPYFEEIKNKILYDKKNIFKYLRKGYLKYRNVNGLFLNRTEKAFIDETIKRPLPLSKKINIICATATIRGALINDLIINETVTFKEYSNRGNGICFYQSNC